jgi:ATP-dependent helicase/nuclease subunit B
MPKTICLTERLPLITKTAKWLAAHSSDRPLDLSRFAVLVPTSGAGRRLRFELVRTASGAGLLSPLLTTPMGLLAAVSDGKIAARTDALLAWMQVISRASSAEYPLLLSGFSDLKSSAFKIAESLMALCSLLGEGAFTPVSPEIVRACPAQEDRWNELKSLFQQYLQCLENVGLLDANLARINAARAGLTPSGIAHVIVAGVPDLNLISQRYLENLETAGVSVTVLVDAPGCDEALFDRWGRPHSGSWPQRELPVRLEDILVGAEPSSEAEIVARLLGRSGAAGLCVTDSDIIPFHERTLRKQGLEPYDPAGKPLATFECATLCRLWLSFCTNGRLAELGTLAEHPVFLRALCREALLSPTVALAVLDEVRTELLLETLDDAVTYFDGDRSAQQRLPQAAALIAGAARLRQNSGASNSLGELPNFLRIVYAGSQVAPTSREAEALGALSDLLQTITGSALSAPELSESVFCEEMKRVPIFEAHSTSEIELNGWLEVPWLPDRTLIVSGCTEGALPAPVAAHAFLPESVRATLGLHSNAQRFARDTYLLHCLLATREPGAVRLTLSRRRSDGEPAKPSRLLFRCPDAELGSRVRRLFGPGILVRTARARERMWLLEIPEGAAPAALRVTAFRDYLRCPLRFYLRHVLQMREFEPGKIELHALDFGTILHKTLERFANRKMIRDSRDPKVIERFVLTELDAVLHESLGQQLSVPVRVQRESLRARLRQFARIQAEERRAGWRIQCGELHFEKEATIYLADLPVVARLDRVDVHERTGRRRILDYKTSARRTTAAEAHFETATGEDHAFETVIEGRMVRWRDLQLPLYRALSQFQWPEETEPSTVGFFLLPERIEESGIDEFALDGSLFASAMSVAQVVANRIQCGNYWPPRAVSHDDYQSIFLGEDPVETLSARSKEFLAGLRKSSVQQ